LTDRDPSGDAPDGRLRPTSPGVVSAWAVVGLVGGWLLRPVAERVDGTAPIVTWLQPLALLFVAAILGATAWITWRQLHVRREYLEPHRAVNRLVLARSCVLVGALVAGGYAGYALTWAGVDSELGTQRVWRSALAAAGGVAIAITAVLLERACRVPEDDGAP
jgi:hypothetical protein